MYAGPGEQPRFRLLRCGVDFALAREISEGSFRCLVKSLRSTSAWRKGSPHGSHTLAKMLMSSSPYARFVVSMFLAFSTGPGFATSSAICAPDKRAKLKHPNVSVGDLSTS